MTETTSSTSTASTADATKLRCNACQEEFDQGTQHECRQEPSDPEALRKSISELRETVTKLGGNLQETVDEAVKRAAGGEPKTPSKRETEPEPRIQVFDRFDELNYSRGDFELAMAIIHGANRMPSQPRLLRPPEDLERAWRYHCFEAPPDPKGPDGQSIKPVGKRNYGQRMARVVGYTQDAEGNRVQRVEPIDPQRAMDTAETGFGAEFIGTQYLRDLWEASRNMDSIVSRIRTIPMSDPTTVVPIDGDLPEMLFVGESTGPSATAYTTSKTATGKAASDLAAKKFTIQQIWSGELEEDSIIAFTPFLRERLNMAAALYLGSSYYNGDDTNAGTGNINSDDADPADTKHYLAYDGIRHYWLVDETGQGKDMAGALDHKEINVARGKLNAGDDDVDNLIKNINWGMNPRDLLLTMDWDTYMALLDEDLVQTIDKYGPNATVVTGELGSFKGIPIISPSYASKTEADGKASGTEANNTKGQITLFNPMGFLAGSRREVQLFFDRIQRTDQFLFELYTRRAFTRFGGNVAAGIYNITV